MEVVNKAAGVFIWVKLVVKSLLEGLGSYDRLSDLKRRLNDLPEDLEDLYWHILKSVKPAFYLEQAAKLLLIAYHAGKPLTLLQLAYTDLEDPDAAGRARFGEFTSEQQVEMAQFTQGRIKTRCLDLLEVPTSSSDADIRHRTVQFMHQSVADFLATSEVKQRLKACLANQLSFSPWGCLMRSSILQLKHLDTVMYSHSNNQPASFLADVWYRQAWYFIREFADYARSMEREKEEAAIIQLINDLDRCAGHLWQLYLSAECRFLLSDEVHWSEMRSEGIDVHLIRRHGSIQSFALENGLHSYVKATAGLMNKSQIEYALLVDEVLQEGADHTSNYRETPHPMSLELRSLLREASKPRVAVGSELVTQLAFWRPDRKYSRDRRLRHIRGAHAPKEEALKDEVTRPSGTNVLISRTVFGAV
ncbi:hypothetical protein GE09DRAFT_1212413 [Coniochaeta sp. 2T2.1]|nr:hypothetical protein GE09DRAFT_1212413 [Coniochaeta sp. 2T2.1]